MKRVFYYINDATEAGIKEHPQKQMENLGIKVLFSNPQSLFDGWEFWIEDSAILPKAGYIQEKEYLPPDWEDHPELL